ANFDRTQLKIILAHEIGHILGLGHSHDESALMYYNASAKEDLNLAQDDIDGITYLYPSDELDGADLAGCGMVSNGVPPAGGGWALLLMLLPMGAWLARQRRYLRARTLQRLPIDFFL